MDRCNRLFLLGFFKPLPIAASLTKVSAERLPGASADPGCGCVPCAMNRRLRALSDTVMPATVCEGARSQFELLSQMIEDIAGELALDPLLGRIVERACKLIGADDGVIVGVGARDGHVQTQSMSTPTTLTLLLYAPGRFAVRFEAMADS